MEYRRNIISQREFAPTRRNPATRNPKLRYLDNSIIRTPSTSRTFRTECTPTESTLLNSPPKFFDEVRKNRSISATKTRLSPTIPFIECKFGEEGCSRDRTNSKRVLLFIAVHSRSSHPMHGSERVKFSHLLSPSPASTAHIRFYSGCSGPADIIRLILDYRRLPVMNFHANEPLPPPFSSPRPVLFTLSGRARLVHEVEGSGEFRSIPHLHYPPRPRPITVKFSRLPFLHPLPIAAIPPALGFSNRVQNT